MQYRLPAASFFPNNGNGETGTRRTPKQEKMFIDTWLPALAKAKAAPKKRLSWWPTRIDGPSRPYLPVQETSPPFPHGSLIYSR
jgi:hypothetical protein